MVRYSSMKQDCTQVEPNYQLDRDWYLQKYRTMILFNLATWQPLGMQ